MDAENLGVLGPILERLAAVQDVTTPEGKRVIWDLAVLLGYCYYWHIPLDSELTILPLEECSIVLDAIEKNCNLLTLNWIPDSIIEQQLGRVLFLLRTHISLALSVVYRSLLYLVDMDADAVSRVGQRWKVLLLRLDEIDKQIQLNPEHPMIAGRAGFKKKMNELRKRIPEEDLDMFPIWLSGGMEV